MTAPPGQRRGPVATPAPSNATITTAAKQYLQRRTSDRQNRLATQLRAIVVARPAVGDYDAAALAAAWLAEVAA